MLLRVGDDMPIYAETVDLIQSLAKNPIAELIVGFALIEKLQDNGVLGDMQGNVMEAAIAGIIIAQQIAPLVPAMMQAGKSLGDVAGGIAALGAVAGA